MACLAVTERMAPPGAMAQMGRMVLLVQMAKTERPEKKAPLAAMGLMALQAKTESAAQMVPTDLTARQAETG